VVCPTRKAGIIGLNHKTCPEDDLCGIDGSPHVLFPMFNFSHLKLRDRTLIGYAIPTILIFGFSGLVYFVASKTFNTFEQVSAGQTKLVLRSEIAILNSNMDRRMRRYLLVGGQDALDLFAKDDQAIDDRFKRLEAIVSEPNQQTIVRQQLALHEDLTTLGKQTVETAKAQERANKSLQATVDDQKALRKQYIRDSLAITDRFEALHTQLDQMIQDQTNQNISDAKSSIVSLEMMAIAVAVISTAMTVIMAYMITNALGQRVTKVVDVADRIATGDLTNSLDHAGSSRDEIGQLMGSFQSMVQRLNTLVSQVQRASIQVTTSCTQLSASGRQLEGTITEQVASTNEVTTTAKQIAATSEELVNTMEELSSLSQTTSHTATDQQQDLLRMGTTMQQLAGATDLISAKLGTISEKAHNITTIVGTITRVADQTNLLSLNAAIEAEKAGEYGLGFSVVAKEIRRLADQTAIATVDIEQMIKEMQSAVSTGVMEMDKFAREVRQGVTEVGNITEQVGLVIVQVQQLTPRFDAVNQGMEMQFQGAQQISEAMTQLSNTSNQTADSLQEINRVIEHLNQAEQSLRREVMQFKIEGSSADGRSPADYRPGSMVGA
jgi:methyl-accepting chemotaxis protein WspA